MKEKAPIGKAGRKAAEFAKKIAAQNQVEGQEQPMENTKNETKHEDRELPLKIVLGSMITLYATDYIVVSETSETLKFYNEREGSKVFEKDYILEEIKNDKAQYRYDEGTRHQYEEWLLKPKPLLDFPLS